MKKLVVVGGTAVGAAAVALLSAGIGASQPTTGQLNVVGEPYYKAVKILHSQGVATGFGGSVGSAMPQAQCLVSSEKMLTNGKIMLMLDCTEEAKQSLVDSAVPGAPTVGSNGVTTVTPTPVGPQPGMPVG